MDVYGKDDMQNYRLSFNLLNIENIGDHIKLTGYIAVSGSSTTLEAIVTGRTSGSSYNKNQRQSTIYAGQNRRIIKMSGYYK